jgi:hypothetical protein
MAKLEKKILEELKQRFNQIGYNSNHLEEQVLNTGRGSGFENAQGNSPRVLQFMKRQEIGEQEDIEAAGEEEELEIPADPEAAGEELEGGEEEVEVGDEEIAGEEGTEEVGDVGMEDEIDTGGESTEVEVTDLVTAQEKIEKEVEDTKSSIESNNEKLTSLLDKLDDLEGQLSGMDDILSQINSIEQKIEKYRPKTSIEKMELRKQHDSGPYDQTLEDFWTDEQDKFKEQGKVDYVLTADEVEDYNKSDIKQSFDSDVD